MHTAGSTIPSPADPSESAVTCSELAIRDGRVRELREERDAVMASVRQRDSALQVCKAPSHLLRENL